MNSSVWSIWVGQCSKEKKYFHFYLFLFFTIVCRLTVYKIGTLCIYASVDLESPITTTLVVMTSIQRAHGGRGSCSHWSKTGIIFQKVRSLNPIPTRLCHVIQEVPACRDFWYQRVIMKCGNHEFRGLFLV